MQALYVFLQVSSSSATMATVKDAKSFRIEDVNANSFEVEPALAVTDVLQPKQNGLVQPGDANATPVPQPPYNETDDVTLGLGCYYPECPFKSYCWGDMLAHMDTTHKLKFKRIEGTYFHRWA